MVLSSIIFQLFTRILVFTIVNFQSTLLFSPLLFLFFDCLFLSFYKYHFHEKNCFSCFNSSQISLQTFFLLFMFDISDFSIAYFISFLHSCSFKKIFHETFFFLNLFHQPFAFQTFSFFPHLSFHKF